MKKVIFIFALLSFTCRIYAQDLTISFQPKVNGTPIDSIWATNLRTNQKVKLFGNESLTLVKSPTGINSLQNNLEVGTIYPNPTDGDATFCFSTDKSQQVELRLFNVSGQLVNQNRQFLIQGIHRYDLKFPVAGIYFISVIKSNGPTSIKVVYTGEKIQASSIRYLGSENLNSKKPAEFQLKSATTSKTISYKDGDVVQYSFFSGVNTTIVSETPSASKAIEVEFISCIDKDNRSYKTVKIGNQWWMAENLAYLPVVSPPTLESYTEPYCYVYGYSDTDVAAAKATANYTTYGVLYNWPAAKTSCPVGWHLPSDKEWATLIAFLGGEVSADKKLKETGTIHWHDLNITATNESGFTALPSGFRSYEGNFAYLGSSCIFWSKIEYNGSIVWALSINSYEGTYITTKSKPIGFSVRCVRD